MLGSVEDYHKALVTWVTTHGRSLPWRAPWGEPQQPYKTWLSEIMLQQTVVATMIPYYNGFIERWPCIETLAQSPVDDILHAWQGLGYYRRARHLHTTALLIVDHYGGQIPDNEKTLLRLPGIGPYVAAAIRAIAFQQYAVVVDGNVERVMTRLFAQQQPLADNRSALRQYARSLTPKTKTIAPGTYAQAVMELGALVCRPKSPRCASCPVQPHCRAWHSGMAETLPTRKSKAPLPIRRGLIDWVESGDGNVAVYRRPDQGLLGGMHAFHGTPWETKATFPSPHPDANIIPEVVRHVFTHFALELRITKRISQQLPTGCFWHPIRLLEQLALPSVMQKVKHVALSVHNHKADLAKPDKPD